jgi:hypothetical protein
LPFERPGEGDRAGVISVALDVADRHKSGQHMIALPEIVTPVGEGCCLLLRSQNTAQCDGTFGREQVTVLPADGGAIAFSGAIAQFARNGPQRCWAYIDRQVDMLSVTSVLGGQCDRRYEPGGDDRAAQVLDVRYVIRIAPFEAGDPRHMTSAEELFIVEDDRTESPVGAGCNDDIQLSLALFMIDPHFRFADAGEGKAILAERERQGGLPRQDRIGIDGIAHLDSEGFAQFRFALARLIQSRQINRRKLITGTRCYIELHSQPVFSAGQNGNGTADARGIIAFGSQQPLEQFAIFLDPPVYLGDIGRLPFAFPQDR